MVEAAQVAGEVVSRSRVGLCDRAARQWKVRPGIRLHVPTVPLCASLLLTNEAERRAVTLIIIVELYTVRPHT